MGKYEIDMTVNYSGVVEADSEEEARDLFIEEREHAYYDSCESETIVKVGE